MISVRRCPHRAEFEALEQLIAAIPRAERARDIEGYIDAKSAARKAVRALMLKVQHASASGPAEPLIAGPRGRVVIVTASRRLRRP